MAILSPKGKFRFLYLLLIFQFSSICNTLDDQSAFADPTETLNVLNQQIAQLGKLEELVKNLSELVARLESRVLEAPSEVRSSIDKLVHEPKIRSDTRKFDEVELVDEGVERLGAVSVTKHSLFWSERFQFVSAVKLDTHASCLNVLPFRDPEGLSKYIAVGDDSGKFYVFTTRYGEVMLQFNTLTNSPVTAMLSYISVFRNESVVVTGHENGVVLVHRVWEIPNGDEAYSIESKIVHRLDQENGLAITILEIHHVGRTRYIVSIDIGGTIRVFKEGGEVMGTIVPKSRPLAFLRQKLLFLTETGAGSIDLRTMKLKEAPCEGLNGSYALNYVFDASDRGKAYGFTSGGELVHLLIYGDSMNFKCRVRSKKKFDVDDGPLAFEAIKGYFLIVSQDKVFVYNVSSQHYMRAGLPRLVFSAGLDEIIASFLNYQAMGRIIARKGTLVPLIASDHDKLVILSLGSGYIGMYRSNLPVTKGEFNTMLWSTPVLFFILFLFVAWHFFANKKEALTSWGPDDPFPNGAPPASRERPFGEPSSRNHDIMDLRGGGGGGGGGGTGGGGGGNASGMRGPPRRYGSPTRYVGPSAANSFRPAAAMDSNARPASVDPDFRGSELKYRGSNIESSGFGKRREGLFVNSQVVDDHGN